MGIYICTASITCLDGVRSAWYKVPISMRPTFRVVSNKVKTILSQYSPVYPLPPSIPLFIALLSLSPPLPALLLPLWRSALNIKTCMDGWVNKLLQPINGKMIWPCLCHHLFSGFNFTLSFLGSSHRRPSPVLTVPPLGYCLWLLNKHDPSHSLSLLHLDGALLLMVDCLCPSTGGAWVALKSGLIHMKLLQLLV